jgi:kynurenine 3-monooxygenase
MFPLWYVPLYSMVTFSRIPYAEAVRRARRQDRAVIAAGVAAFLILVLLLVLALDGGP